MKKDIKDYYCEVTQEQANEAKELLLKYGEPIWNDEVAFNVRAVCFTLKCGTNWYVGDDSSLLENKTKVTYEEWKSILVAQFEDLEAFKDSFTKVDEALTPFESTIALYNQNQPTEPIIGEWYYFMDDMDWNVFVYGKLESVDNFKKCPYSIKNGGIYKHCLTLEQVNELKKKL